MKRFALVAICGLFMMAFAGSSGATDSVLSSYTRQLIDLMKLFDKLNEATAEQMEENERLLMADAMVRLSGGFYDLKVNKKQFVDAVAWSVTNHQTSPDIYSLTIRLRSSLSCLTSQLNSDGARIGALVKYDGPAVERQLRMTLEDKIDRVDKLVQELGLDPSAPDVLANVISDGQAAEQAAESLYLKTNEFAHILNPSVLPPRSPHTCTANPRQ